MAATCEPSPTREKLLDMLIKKDIKIGYGDLFRKSIVETLEEILSISRDKLCEAEANRFDDEANEFYSYVPSCLKKAGRNKKTMKNRFKKYFGKEIIISVEVSDQVCIFKTFLITIDHRGLILILTMLSATELKKLVPKFSKMKPWLHFPIILCGFVLPC